jgi:hypothetical protein
MNTQQAQSAVSLSAFVVAVIFAYRKLVEPAASTKKAPSTGHFVIGFGFTYITLSIFAEAAPAFGGMMAILVAAGDLLVNGTQLVADVNDGLTRTKAATTTKGSSSSSTPGAFGTATSLTGTGTGTAGGVTNVTGVTGITGITGSQGEQGTQLETKEF